jgi:ubiquinone/menaquinone biosynthesis C-methylase UbiE
MRVALVSFLLALAAGFALVEAFDDDELSRIVEVLDVDAGEAFADVGAGDGRFSVGLAKAVGDGGRIYANEVDPDDLKKIRDRMAKEKLGNVEVVNGSHDSTGLPDACCDGILLRRVYHHFQNPVAMQASMRRALREGGLLLVIDFGTHRSWSRPEGVPSSREGHGIERDLLVEELGSAGFELVREEEWEGDDYAFLFRAVTIDLREHAPRDR